MNYVTRKLLCLWGEPNCVLPEEDRGRSWRRMRGAVAMHRAPAAELGWEAQPCCRGPKQAAGEAWIARGCTQASLRGHKNLLLNIPMLTARVCIYPALCQKPKPLSRRPERLILTPLNRWKVHEWETQE